MMTLKLTRFGDSVGVIFPLEVLAQLKLGEGDAVYLTHSPDGFRLTPHNPDFEEQLTVARDVFARSRDVLRELAK